MTRNLIIFPAETCAKRPNSYILITIVITLCLLWACSRSTEEETPAKKDPVSPQLLADSDKLFDQRQELANLREAVANMNRARRENAKSFDVESRLARYNYYLCRHSDDEKEREKAFEDGKAAAKSASKMEPNKPDGYF